MSIYSGLKCRPLLWLLLGFKFFLVISETPPFIKTHSALIYRFLNQLIDVLQGLGICRNTSFIFFFMPYCFRCVCLVFRFYVCVCTALSCIWVFVLTL